MYEVLENFFFNGSPIRNVSEPFCIGNVCLSHDGKWRFKDKVLSDDFIRSKVVAIRTSDSDKKILNAVLSLIPVEVAANIIRQELGEDYYFKGAVKSCKTAKELLLKYFQRYRSLIDIAEKYQAVLRDIEIASAEAEKMLSQRKMYLPAIIKPTDLYDSKLNDDREIQVKQTIIDEMTARLEFYEPDSFEHKLLCKIIEVSQKIIEASRIKMMTDIENAKKTANVLKAISVKIISHSAGNKNKELVFDGNSYCYGGIPVNKCIIDLLNDIERICPAIVFFANSKKIVTVV
jgi:hypothetical protein